MRTFLETPRNFSGPKPNFGIKTCWIVAQFLAHKPVNSASLSDRQFRCIIFKIIETFFLNQVQTRQTLNSFPDPKSFRDEKRAPDH